MWAQVWRRDDAPSVFQESPKQRGNFSRLRRDYVPRHTPIHQLRGMPNQQSSHHMQYRPNSGWVGSVEEHTEWQPKAVTLQNRIRANVEAVTDSKAAPLHQSSIAGSSRCAVSHSSHLNPLLFPLNPHFPSLAASLVLVYFFSLYSSIRNVRKMFEDLVSRQAAEVKRVHKRWWG